MGEKTINTFQAGLNLDVSDMVMKPDTIRWAQNVRLVNLEGSSFLVSNLNGNEVLFNLTTGYQPVACAEYDRILYIISWNSTEEKIEFGSYPSKDPLGGTNIYVYRPFDNLIGGPTVGGVDDALQLLLTDFDSELPNSFPIISKLEIQPDYDRSVNLLFTIQGYKPRIVNSYFKQVTTSGALTIGPVEDRVGPSNSNTYELSTITKETATIIYSDKILKIAYNSISSGGKLKPGNYLYVLHYMTEDFNKTGVVGQSSVCQVAFGTTDATRRGGDETDETNLRVVLDLSEVDTDFKYFKVYAQYNSGQEATQTQYLEFTQPIPITSTTMQFIHTGYEELAEVSSDEVNVDYSTIEGADASTQVGGFYFLGGIKQKRYDYDPFEALAATIEPIAATRSISPGVLSGYNDPANVYRYMGLFGGETYPYGIVFIMPGGELSPVFPIKGRLYAPNGLGFSNDVRGLVTMPSSAFNGIYTSGAVNAKYLKMKFPSVSQSIKDASLGFFFVRGERRENMIAQGLMIPTLRVPPVQFTATGSNGGANYKNYYRLNPDETVVGKYVFVPCVDSMMEAWRRAEDQSGAFDDKYVLNSEFTLSSGYMPIPINDLGAFDTAPNPVPDVFSTLHWAFISGDGLLNEPELITRLAKLTDQELLQLGKIQFRVTGALNNVSAEDTGGAPPTVGMHYNMERIDNYFAHNLKTIKRVEYVPGETFASGSDFASKADFRIIHRSKASPGAYAFSFDVQEYFNSYFGIEMTDAPTDSSKSATNPIGGNARIPTFGGLPYGAEYTQTPGVTYSNLGQLIPGGFLVNIYTQSGIQAGANLYSTTDSIVYKQVSERYTWDDIPASGSLANMIEVFGGDCYIGKVSRKLYQSGYRIPNNSSEKSSLSSLGVEANIDMGMMVTWYQEAKYNLGLRQQKQFDDSETAERSFFPLQSYNDYLKYRGYRYPETLAHSPGYSELFRPKSLFTTSELAPVTEDYFFSRIAHSERHVPNAFKNGYRSFLQANYRDYDTSMGQITAMYNHRGRLVVVFEHGIGVTEIQQRIQTGSDAAGAIFVEPSDVLPETMTYISREIGCQNHLGMVQAPGALYGVDYAKDKLWKITEGLKVISDDAVSSFLTSNPAANPRLGYDFQNNEVLFTTDNWTLCFAEGLDKFVSFYSFPSTLQLYAKRDKYLYSFLAGTAWQHNKDVFTLYGQAEDTIIEFVVNKGTHMAKTFDFINLISNEIAPEKVEFYSYNQDVEVGSVIPIASLNQYGIVNYEVDVITEEYTIVYRDKKYVVQVPVRSAYKVGSDEDEWDIEGRIRDKYIIIRLTYNTDKPLELASVVTSFRYSHS